MNKGCIKIKPEIGHKQCGLVQDSKAKMLFLYDQNTFRVNNINAERPVLMFLQICVNINKCH